MHLSQGERKKTACREDFPSRQAGKVQTADVDWIGFTRGLDIGPISRTDPILARRIASALISPSPGIPSGEGVFFGVRRLDAALPQGIQKTRSQKTIPPPAHCLLARGRRRRPFSREKTINPSPRQKPVLTHPNPVRCLKAVRTLQTITARNGRYRPCFSFHSLRRKACNPKNRSWCFSGRSALGSVPLM